MIPRRDWSRGWSNGAWGGVVAHTCRTAAKTNGWVIFVANSRVASRVTGGRATSESPCAWPTALPIANDATMAASDSALCSSKSLSEAFLIILVPPEYGLQPEGHGRGAERRYVTGPPCRAQAELRDNRPPPSQQTALLFDHLVGQCEQRDRYSQAQRLGGFEIDHQLEL